MEKIAIYQYKSRSKSFINLQSVFLLLLLGVNGVLSTRSDRDSSPPTIIPNEHDITVTLNKNYRLTCMATEPIYWRFHKRLDFEIHMNYNRSNKYMYESELDLYSVDIAYVGYYYCVKNSSEANANIETLLKHNQAAQIYVFVDKDRRRPLVPASYSNIEGNQYEEILIPCKPTSKSFEVQLLEDGNRREIKAPFDPREGFRLKLNSTSDAKRYVCHAKFDKDELYDNYFIVTVNAVSSNILSEPIITSETENFGIENGQLELKCTVKVASMINRLEMKWELPNENIAEKEGRVRIIQPVVQKLEHSPEPFEASGKLIVKNWDEEKDAGSYQCLLNDINSIKLATLRVKRNFEYQKPQLNLSDVFYNVGERISVNCDITSYPASTVQWSFTPCEDVDLDIDFGILCDESKRVTFNEKGVRTFPMTRSTQRSILNFSPNGMGVVICEATNTEDKIEARANVIVNDKNGNFTIRNENEMPIVVGDDVSIICGASAFKYTDMNWYKDNILVTNTTNVQVITKNTPRSQQKEIHWKSIGKEAAGHYVCRVKMINSDSYADKSWELQMIEPTLPSIVSSNFESDQSQKYLMNDEVKLLCKFSAIPNPKIKWLKDNKEIIAIANSKHLTLLEDNTILKIHLNADDEGKYRCVAENRAGRVEREMKLIIENAPRSAAYKFTPLAIGIIPLSGICIVCLFSRYRR